jgi:hypothetical protein
VGAIKPRKYKARSQKKITEKRVTGVLKRKFSEVKKTGLQFSEVKKTGLQFSEDLAVAIRC